MAIQLTASGICDTDGIGLKSYNNFGISDTISMIRGFTDGMDYRESEGSHVNGAGTGGIGMNRGKRNTTLDSTLVVSG